MEKTNYRSLVAGGFYSKTPMDRNSAHVSIRMNNPGAVNGATWERTYPGYVDEVETTPGNHSTIFEAPEYGIAAWWELLRKYRMHGVITVAGIINRYGGGQDYSVYLTQVLEWSGLKRDTVIDLYNDEVLLRFAKAMFKYEAGTDLPWLDAQLLYGFQMGRAHAAGATSPPYVPQMPATPEGFWSWLLRVLTGRG